MKLLEGIRVLDMTNVLAGPFATLHLSLLGADVIKIENPDGGDLARKLGNVPEYNRQLLGTSFLAQNANKKSLTLNMKAEEGKEIFLKLVKTADVLVENFRPGSRWPRAGWRRFCACRTHRAGSGRCKPRTSDRTITGRSLSS